MVNDCQDCRNENHFCKVHQKHEKEVYESAQFRGKHDTQEFRMALYDAKQRDLYEYVGDPS